MLLLGLVSCVTSPEGAETPTFPPPAEGSSATEAKAETEPPAAVPKRGRGRMMVIERVDFPVRGTLVQVFDERWMRFPRYLNRVNDLVRQRWRELGSRIEEARAESPTEIEVRFYLTAEGYAEDAVFAEEGAPEMALAVCRDAVLSAGSFGLWTDEMRAVFGDRTEVRITFLF